MTLGLRPIASTDLQRVAYIRLAAFAGTPAAQVLRPGPITPEMLSWMGGRIEKDFKQPNINFLGVFDDGSGELIAYAEWEIVDAQARESPEEKTEWPSFKNGKAYDEFWDRYEQVKHDVMGDRDYLLLSILATDKPHQGRGAASILLRRVIEHAAEKSVDIFLDATDAGKPLYEKFGFEIKKETKMDFGPHGVDHNNLTWGMVRAPGPAQRP